MQKGALAYMANALWSKRAQNQAFLCEQTFAEFEMSRWRLEIQGNCTFWLQKGPKRSQNILSIPAQIIIRKS